jgi:hypothetical protein
MTLAFPKPKDAPRQVETVITYPDGREECNSDSRAGREEYKRRTDAMRRRQGAKCGICHNPMRRKDMTFEHTDLRGMGGGRRDDRIVDAKGKPMNLAAHGWCNREKGSRRDG